MPIVNCRYCKKEMDIPQYKLDNGRGKYCSRSCLAKHTFIGMKRAPRSDEHRKKLGLAHIGKSPPNKGELISVKCEICGKIFEVWPSRIKRANVRYCSRQCSHEAKRKITGIKHPLWKSEQRKCEWCGNVVWVKPCKFKEFRYCSRRCQGAATAQKLARKNGPTTIEKLLMDELDNCGIQYNSQKRIAVWLIDIVLPKYRIAIEADGDYWHNNPKQQQKDANKNHWLITHKWTIFRFPEYQIRKSPKQCIDQILVHINQK